jgi:hypothetical protein
VTERLRADEALRKSKEELRELASVASSIREQEKAALRANCTTNWRKR